MRSFADWTIGAAAMHSVEHQEVYLAHGIAGEIEPAKMTGAKILALATGLRDLQQARKKTAA